MQRIHEGNTMQLSTDWCHYEEGACLLHLTIPWDQRELRMHSWEEGCLLEQKTASGRWRYDDTDLPIVSDIFTGGDSSHPVSRFAAHLPHDVVARVRLFQTDQLAMLQLCSASERARQLVHSHPTLLWFIAPHLEGFIHDAPRLHRIFGLKRRALLDMVCNRSAAWVVRLLEQLPPTGSDVAARSNLEKLLNTGNALENLRHCRQVDWPLLALAARYASVLSSPIVRSIFHSEATIRQKQSALATRNGLIRDSLRLGEILGIENVHALIAHCKTLRQLSHLHERWTIRVTEINFTRKIQEIGDDLPLPPLPGTKDIVPLATVTDLLNEGHIMHHCVGGYVRSVRTGECYIYKVTAPERATVEIAKDAAGNWRPVQIKGHCNAKPGMPTVIAVQQWLLKENANRKQKAG